MEIPPAQVAYKKQIGKLGDDPVFELGLKGGLHLVVAARKKGAETLGVGPHRAVARHIAKKREPELKITELAKSDHYEVAHFAHVLPRYEEQTEQFRQRELARRG